MCTQTLRHRFAHRALDTVVVTELSPQEGGALAPDLSTQRAELSPRIAITHFDVNIVGEKEDVSPDHMRAVLQGVIGLIDNSV